MHIEYRVPIPGGLGCWEKSGGRGNWGPSYRGTLHSRPAPGNWGDPLPTVSSSAADAESQDPDSTGHLESEAPRDYFLKCEWTLGSPLC